MIPGKIQSRTEVKRQERNLPFALTSYEVARGMGPPPPLALEVKWRDMDPADLGARRAPTGAVLTSRGL